MKFLNLFTEQSFQIQFLANIIVGLLIVILFSYLFPRYLEKLKKPKIKIFIKEGKKDVYKINKLADGQWEKYLEFG